MLDADTINDDQTEIDGCWVAARPLRGPFLWRLWDALAVLRGNADAVRWYKQ